MQNCFMYCTVYIPASTVQFTLSDYTENLQKASMQFQISNI